MLAVAPGLRATDSTAEPTALPWPRPQRPAASAMPMPMPIGARLTGAEPPSAKAGAAQHRTARTIRTNCSLRIYFSSFPEIGRQWVVEAHRAGPLTLAAFRLPGAEALSGGILFLVLDEVRGATTLVLVRHRLAQVNHRQQRENDRLNH